MGSGGFTTEPDNLTLDRYALELTGAARPRVCFVPTASGDLPEYIDRFHAVFTSLGAQTCHVTLVRDTVSDLTDVLCAQDLIYVGGGNSIDQLNVWKRCGADVALRQAWEQGVVLAGLSAGSVCWFRSFVTDSLGPELAPYEGGLGFLPFSHCPHYSGDPRRRPAYLAAVADGLQEGYAADDGAGLVFRGTTLSHVVSSHKGPTGYFVRRERDGDVVEERLEARVPAARMANAV